MPFEVLPEFDPLKTVIKVIGVGGGRRKCRRAHDYPWRQEH